MSDPPACTVNIPAPHSVDTTRVCVAEKHLQFTQSARMAVMRQYVSLSGSHGVQDLAAHFQNDFLPAWKSMFEGGGHSLGSAALDILRNAQWMKPSSALNYGQPTVDLAVLGGQRTGCSGSSSTAGSKTTTSSKELQGARPYAFAGLLSSVCRGGVHSPVTDCVSYSRVAWRVGGIANSRSPHCHR